MQLRPAHQCCVSEGVGSFNIALGAQRCSDVHFQTKLRQPNRFIFLPEFGSGLDWSVVCRCLGPSEFVFIGIRT